MCLLGCVSCCWIPPPSIFDLSSFVNQSELKFWLKCPNMKFKFFKILKNLSRPQTLLNRSGSNIYAQPSQDRICVVVVDPYIRINSLNFRLYILMDRQSWEKGVATGTCFVVSPTRRKVYKLCRVSFLQIILIRGMDSILKICSNSFLSFAHLTIYWCLGMKPWRIKYFYCSKLLTDDSESTDEAATYTHRRG